MLTAAQGVCGFRTGKLDPALLLHQLYQLERTVAGADCGVGTRAVRWEIMYGSGRGQQKATATNPEDWSKRRSGIWSTPTISKSCANDEARRQCIHIIIQIH